MKGLRFIEQKQQSYAQRHGLELINGSKAKNVTKYYLQTIEENLFEPLSQESADSYNSGDGGETKDTDNRLAKMKALDSSSVIVVNLFQYWQGKDLSPLLHALKLRRKSQADVLMENVGTKTPTVTEIRAKECGGVLRFEQKFKISDDKNSFPRPANLDVVIEEQRYHYHTAIESKFAEPYRDKPKGLREAYLNDESLWEKLPNLYELAKLISHNTNLYKHLDVAQLIKHILGLSANYPKKDGKSNVKFRLLYLWYDVLGEDGAEHKKEIEKFAEVAQKDNINFRNVTYQEVITTLATDYYKGNESYIDYLTDRYL